jgi:lipopolysaccharide/colanic/teichoic acid biosynthesis glycosyltransferase
MSTSLVLLDRPAPFCRRDDGLTSVLQLTLGTESLFQHVRRAAAGWDTDRLIIAPTCPVDEAYVAELGRMAPDADVRPLTDGVALLRGFESSDALLLVDCRYQPFDQPALNELLAHRGDPWLVRYAAQADRSGRGTAEQVRWDETARVQTVERLYDGVTRVHTAAVSAVLVSAGLLRDVECAELGCLRRLRSGLVARGVPGRDVPTTRATADVSTAAGYLRYVHAGLTPAALGTPPAGYAAPAPTTWVADDAEVAATARLYGPVIVQPRARIGAGAVVIGPAVIGAGAELGVDVLLSGAVVATTARVPDRAEVIERYVSASAGDDMAQVPITEAEPDAQDDEPLDMLAALPKAARRDRRYRSLKRAIDATLAAIGLLLLAPLLAVVAVIVRLTSPGPAFFGHEREGRGGRVFRCWKFRTMVDGAHALQRALYEQNKVDGPQFKMDSDPRVTPVGGFLRASNIDELPQLFNVLRGDMSLIGPRPSPFRENQICVPWREARLSVRPGITGLWQVCRHERDAGDFHQWIYFDTLYVRYRSLALDVRVFVATFLTLGGRWGVPVEWMIPQLRRQRKARLRAAGQPPRPERRVPAKQAAV